MAVSSRIEHHSMQSDAKRSRWMWRQHAERGSYVRMSVRRVVGGMGACYTGAALGPVAPAVRWPRKLSMGCESDKIAMSTTEFETVIGLEIHSQVLTRSKMYCG